MDKPQPSLIIALVPIIAILALLLAGVWYMRRRGYSGPTGETIVRCREGHLFTTVWIPFVSFKAIRLGIMRIQRCPVGNHLTVVTPVRESELTDTERELAARYRDTRLP